MPFTLKSGHLIPTVAAIAVALGVGFFVGAKHRHGDPPSVNKTSYQHEMDAYCIAKLNDSLSKLSSDSRKMGTDQAFFSLKLHTCVQVEVISDPKDAGAMNYLVSDLTYGFVAPPKWHHTDSPLHVHMTDYGSDHHLFAEGYWMPVSSEPGQQSVSEANAVNLTCDYSNGGPNVSFEELPEVPFAHAAVEQPNAVAPFQQRFADGLCFRFAVRVATSSTRASTCGFLRVRAITEL